MWRCSVVIIRNVELGYLFFKFCYVNLVFYGVKCYCYEGVRGNWCSE